MNVKLWLAKKLTRKIEKDKNRKVKFDYYSGCVAIAIKRDTKKLNKLLGSLTKEENIEYGYQNGFIPEADYLIMKLKMEEEHENSST